MCEFEGCGKSFLRKGHLQRHCTSAHMKERPFVCLQGGCGAAFALKHHLTRHEKLHTKCKPFECKWPDCLAAFSKHEQLRAHVSSEHTGESLFKCEKCCMEFGSRREFRRHEKSAAHGSREYVCGVDGCGRAFPKWTQVVLHRKSEEHKKDLCDSSVNLYCEECGRGPFKSEASHRQHSRIHCETLMVVKHICPQCEKEFSSRSSLKAHSRAVHSTEKPFMCEECGKSYGYKKLLKRHTERHHRTEDTATDEGNEQVAALKFTFFKERSLMCSFKDCPRRFFRQYDLDRHMQSIHPSRQ